MLISGVFNGVRVFVQDENLKMYTILISQKDIDQMNEVAGTDKAVVTATKAILDDILELDFEEE